MVEVDSDALYELAIKTAESGIKKHEIATLFKLYMKSII